MKSLGLALFGLALLCTPAAAAPADGSEAESTFDRCMDRASQTGVMLEMQDCANGEYDRLDKLLNATYRNLLARLEPDRKESLRASQRAWLTFAKAECEYAGSADRGGSLANLEITNCWIDLMNERIEAFKQDAASEPDGDAPKTANPVKPKK